ncbi:neutral zinc metallopeptidase [Sphaerisporangium corydalis]|uniref:Neutral zinc metallopeptidase n=1 Tax=Sphaerisporangium corydalis TaxID=1441875 RepID=A0ABV9EBI3_9ACTN|nr:neutral zinc metallopeptidase [Sphaerisporangium corydalis]
MATNGRNLPPPPPPPGGRHPYPPPQDPGNNGPLPSAAPPYPPRGPQQPPPGYPPQGNPPPGRQPYPGQGPANPYPGQGPAQPYPPQGAPQPYAPQQGPGQPYRQPYPPSQAPGRPPQGQPYPAPPPPGGQAPAPYPPPGPGWGGPPGTYGPPGHLAPNWRPPKRKSGAGAVIGGILGVLAAVFVLLIVGSAALRSAKHSDPVSPVAIPTYQPPSYEPNTPPPLPTYSSGPETTTSTAPQTSRTPDTTTTTRADTSNQTTTTRPALNRTLTGNTVYKAGTLPRLPCRASATNIYNDAQLKALILKTGQCMSRTWAPALRRVGIAFSQPGYAITARGGRGACGDFPQRGSIVPYYCPRNTTIYASTSALSRGKGNARGYGSLSSWHGAIIAMMAHEYGHHVQQLSGLANSWWGKTLASRSSSGKLALSRKYELQANCFSGMWMRSVAASYPIPPARRGNLYYFFSNVGDWPQYPRDHGSPPNSGRWFRQGYERQKAYQCNTWLAPASSTS